MLVVIFLLPFFSVESYTITKNTTSHLGAQHAPYAWIMNITFVALSLGAIVGGWRFYRGFLFHRITLIVFGLALISAAYFQHKPILPHVTYDVIEDEWHSLFSTITGFSFTLLAISTAFIVNENSQRYLAIAIGVLATALSILMFTFEEQMGIWQRIIFISSFGWMIYIFNTAKNRI